MAELPLGLLGFAAGAMQAGRKSQTPLGFGEALGGALQSGLQNYGLLSQMQSQQQNQQMRQMAMMQDMARQKREIEQQTARQQALQQWTAGLPEDKRALAALAPDAFIDAQVKSQFETPKPPPSRTRTEGGMEILEEWNPQEMRYVKVSEGPRWAPQSPQESWRPLNEAEAQQYGVPPGGVYQISSGGQIRQVTSPGSGGIRMEYDAEGRPILSIGGREQGPSSTPLTNSAESAVQREVNTLLDQQARVARIGEYWRPEFQQLGSRLSAGWSAGMERLGFELDPEQQQQLAEFTQSKAAALSDLNRTLQELSGAAVTESEAGRFQGELPSPGTGLFDGDSPTQFQAKLWARQRDLRLALARKVYLLKNGIEHNIADGNTGGVSISDMPGIIDARGAELEAELVAQGIPAEQAEQQAAAALRREFGL